MTDTAVSYRLGLLLITGSMIALSLGGFFTRLIGTDTPTLLMWRGLFGAAGILAFTAWHGSGFRGFGWPGLGYALVSSAGMLCFIWSLQFTSVAHNSIIYAAMPFFAGGLGWLVTGECMSRGAILAGLAALCGVAVMVGAGAGEGGLFGDFLSVMMTLCVAGMVVLSRRYRSIPMLAAAALSALITALAMAPFAQFAVPPPLMLAELAAFGLVNSALGLALFTLGARLLPPAETALIGALDAPLAPVWVWAAFGETPVAATFIGGAIVMAAVTAHVLSSVREMRPS